MSQRRGQRPPANVISAVVLGPGSLLGDVCYTAHKPGEGNPPITHTREMLDTYPGTVVMMDADALVECIEACFDCSQSCTSCADACLGEEMAGHLKRCITMCLNCSDVCATTGRIVSRQTEFDPAMIRAAVQTCAEACRLCGEECEHHAREMDMEHCRVCAEACRRCEEACDRALTAV